MSDEPIRDSTIVNGDMVADQAEGARQAAKPICETCGGTGLIGGFEPPDGHRDDPCPKCNPASVPDAMQALREKIGGYIDAIRLGATNEGVTNAIMRDVARLATPSPSGDSAEGDPCPYCQHEMHGADDCEKCGMGSPERSTRAATPKPAPPDAVREALTKELSSVGITNHRHGSPGGQGHSSVDISLDLKKRLVAYLSSTPAPSPDARAFDDAVPEAAEPDVWQSLRKTVEDSRYSNEAIGIYVRHHWHSLATPPVRGDREEAAKAVVRLAISDGEWLGRHDNLEPSVTIRIRELAVKVRTESILSLPVQSGAGERE